MLEAVHLPTVGRGALGMRSVAHQATVSREVQEMWVAARQHTESREAQARGKIADPTALAAVHQLIGEALVHLIHLVPTTDQEALVECNREDQDLTSQIEVDHPVPVAAPT